jgi:hypothetical protein
MRACMQALQVRLAAQIPGNNTGCQYGVGVVRYDGLSDSPRAWEAEEDDPEQPPGASDLFSASRCSNQLQGLRTITPHLSRMSKLRKAGIIAVRKVPLPD